MSEKKPFYGWVIAACTFFTFGLAVGIPYYSGPFFYDYYMKPVSEGGFGWAREAITLGPVLALLMLWVAPVIVPRFSPRKLLIVGAGLSAIAFAGFGQSAANIAVFYAMWFIYIVGYLISGPIPHQVLISKWFRKKRGTAMAIAYLGVGVFAAISVKWIAAPLTAAFGFKTALLIMGGMILLVWPIALLGMKDSPETMGQFADGAPGPPADVNLKPEPFSVLFRSKPFWLLLIGSACSIGSIGAINQHMKLIFFDEGFKDQALLDSTFANALFWVALSSVLGRLLVGVLADLFPKKFVMVAIYFLIAATIPILLLISPETEYIIYGFAILFGFGMGADYMLIPLMAAEQFGVNTLARAMAIILPTDTIAQFGMPQVISILREATGSYERALMVLFITAAVGAIAILMLPRHGRADTEILVSKP